MFQAFANVVKSIDKFQDLKKSLDELSKKDVLVGIPQEESSREGSEQITNAELAYIHTHGVRARSMREDMKPELDKGTPYSKAYDMYIQSHGSPLWHSPPRPIIEPAIEHNKEQISKQSKKVLEKALKNESYNSELDKMGMVGQNAARDWFNNPENGWTPNAQSTIEAKGSEKPLIDTGELRKSITYVVRERK